MKKNKWLYLPTDLHFKGIFQLTLPVLDRFFIQYCWISTFTVQIVRRDVPTVPLDRLRNDSLTVLAYSAVRPYFCLSVCRY